MTIQVVLENPQWVTDMSRKTGQEEGRREISQVWRGIEWKWGGHCTGAGSVCMKVCACVSWQGSGSGGAAEQGRATFMHLL